MLEALHIKLIKYYGSRDTYKPKESLNKTYILSMTKLVPNTLSSCRSNIVRSLSEMTISYPKLYDFNFLLCPYYLLITLLYKTNSQKN